MMESLFWCIVGIAGSAFVSFIFYLLGLKRKTLVYNLTTTTLISKNNSQLENLKIKYNKNKINTLYSSQIEIQNIGNTIIEKTDFSASCPLAITTNGEFILDKDGKIKQDRESSNNISFVLDENNSQNTLKRAFISFDYIPKKESISLFVFHTEPIHISGKLKDGKISSQSNSSKINTNINPAIISAIIGAIATIFAALIGYVSSSQQTDKQIQQIIDSIQTNYENESINANDIQKLIDMYYEQQQLIEDLKNSSE